jgi:hypothetical protein
MLCNPWVGEWPLPEFAYGSHKSQDLGSILLPTPEPIANLRGFHLTIQGAPSGSSNSPTFGARSDELVVHPVPPQYSKSV